MPVSPWIGSTITAAVEPSMRSRSRISGRIASKPGTMGANGACLDSCGVALRAPYVRPWNAPCSETIPRASAPDPAALDLRASLIAASTASAPLLAK